jgi:hypothetical protein
MNEQEALARMVAPGTPRPGKWRQGVIQIHVTRACDKACFSCTQGSNLGGKLTMISLENFEKACVSLKDYFGVVGVFGGNPAMHPKFKTLCEILRKHIPYEQRGLWCNNPLGKGVAMKATFNPAVSNLNVHLDEAAYGEFKRDWPQSMPFGLDKDSRHSPCYVALKDVVPDEGERWQLISRCDINIHWSAMLCEFRGQLRAFFCEIAGAQAMLHQWEKDYPDTGLPVETLYTWTDEKGESQPPKVFNWWQLPMSAFSEQVRKHCHECSVPLRGYGQLACGPETQVEQTSATHEKIFKPKRSLRLVQVVADRTELHEQALARMTDYIGNAGR